MVLLILVAVLAWCLVPLPLAVVLGRAFGAAGHGAGRPTRRDYDLVA